MCVSETVFDGGKLPPPLSLFRVEVRLHECNLYDYMEEICRIASGTAVERKINTSSFLMYIIAL